MAEQAPISQPEERFTDIYASRFLKPGREIQMPGDPETLEDFARAHAYLESITAHLIEFGPVWEKAPNDILIELQHHNAWQLYQIEMARKAGEKTAAYREINLQNLRALSQR